MSSDIAIRVTNLSKCYHIYDNPRDRLKQFVLPRFKRAIELFRQIVTRHPSPVTDYYKEFWALKDVSFEVKRGETVGIIGRNGSGKSTLLQMICGTLTPSSGTVETFGRVAALLELGSGFNPEFTGRENVYMNGAILGLSQNEIDIRYDDIAAFADIGDFIEQPVKTYSSGMQVRLAFAVAINVDPQILIVDEALSVGDELFQRKCFSRIEAIKNAGATILFVSHSGSTVVELCDHALLLDAGENLAMGVPKIMVGKYQKLLYAPQEKRLAIREEIRGHISAFHIGERSLEKNDISENKKNEHSEPDEFFDVNLKPQSTLEYEAHGVYIEQPEILTLAGDKVNCLKRGNSYRYIYKVRFERCATNVRFGMLIKTTSGLELGGATSMSSVGQGVACLEPGSVASVEFQFQCNLNPATYFLNAGVTGVFLEEEIYLHRVLDICMFKVMPVSGNTATVLVDFKCIPEVIIHNRDVVA